MGKGKIGECYFRVLTEEITNKFVRCCLLTKVLLKTVYHATKKMASFLWNVGARK